MSKLFENKQLVHIASETVVILGVVFYFSQQNKKLSSHIENLAQRLEEQEDLVRKYNSDIKQLQTLVNSLMTKETTRQPLQPILKHKQTPRKREVHTKPPLSPPKNIEKKPESTVVEFSDLSDSDDNLSAELEDELSDLKQDDCEE